MINYDKISVIIPMYNSERTIIRCLNSVINQTYIATYEIIIVNDGSTDNSFNCVKEYLKKHSAQDIILIDKLNGGVATARNAGLRKATGDWIALLDSDDEWLPNKIEVQINILQENQLIDFLGCNLLNQEIRILGYLVNKLSKVTVNQLFIKMFPQTSTAIFKKEILKDVGFYDESLRYYEEGDYWIRICSQKQFWFHPDKLVEYDGGKPGFGFNGMTARLAEMNNGNMIILKRLYATNKINLPQYFIIKSYAQLKYLRRILIVKLRKKSSIDS